MNLTLVDFKDNFYFKRDDYYNQFNVYGGKVRSAYKIISENTNAKGFTTAGSKQSPQIIICSTICENLKIPFVAHTPSGKLSKEFEKIINNSYTNIVQHKAGYNSVIIKRAKDYALENDFCYIPFGMECDEAILGTAEQINNLPFDKIKRIVVPVGSGMSLLGILKGLKDKSLNISVIGIVVGADPMKRLFKFSLKYNINLNNLKLIRSEESYETYIKDNIFCGIDLDPIYEAKCIPYLQENDLLWIVGHR